VAPAPKHRWETRKSRESICADLRLGRIVAPLAERGDAVIDRVYNATGPKGVPETPSLGDQMRPSRRGDNGRAGGTNEADVQHLAGNRRPKL
jgi:hypothetical protein